MADDAGTVLLWLVGVAAVALLAVAVAVDASSLYLTRRALVAAADAAALDAAQGLDAQRVYTRGLGPTLPLRPAEVRDRVRAYVRDADLAQRFEGISVLSAGTDGTTVVVRLGSVVRPPFRGLLPGGAATVRVVAESRARVPVR